MKILFFAKMDPVIWNPNSAQLEYFRGAKLVVKKLLLKTLIGIDAAELLGKCSCCYNFRFINRRF